MANYVNGVKVEKRFVAGVHGQGPDLPSDSLMLREQEGARRQW